jgi:hypothetical protein
MPRVCATARKENDLSEMSLLFSYPLTHIANAPRRIMPARVLLPLPPLLRCSCADWARI